MKQSLIAFVFSMLIAEPCFANVPVIDDGILTKRAETSAVKAKIKLIQDDHNTARKGIRCAVKTGKSGQTTDPVRQGDTTTGGGTIQQYAPGAQRPQTGDASSGSVGAGQMIWDQTAAVEGGRSAAEGSITSNKKTYESLSSNIGSSQTVMQSWDENSIIRSQNALTLNNAIQVGNLLTQAFNVQNLANIADTSSSANAVQNFTSSTTTPSPARSFVCPTGLQGSGTQIDPCRPQVCSTTGYGITPDRTCVSKRYIDSVGNVVYYLAANQQNATASELEAAMSAYQNQ